MSRFPRLRRRPDHWSSPHERARVRAAERLDGPLGLAESEWLDEHLASCVRCASIAAAYERDRTALRALRTATPEPPRDLWARTSAAIEREAAARGRAPRAARQQGRRMPLGAMSGIAVIAVVVGVSAISSGVFSGSSAVPITADAQRTAGVQLESAPSSAAAYGVAAPTPMAVGPGEVQWVRMVGDGSLAYNAARIDEVCPVDASDGCATVADRRARALSFQAEPETIISSPADEGQAIVVSRDTAGGQEILLVDLPHSDDASAVASGSPTATHIAPSGTPVPSAGSSKVPPATSPDPEDSGTDTSGESGGSQPSIGPSTEPAPPVPSAEPTSGPLQASPSPTDLEGSPALSPEPTVSASLAIASDVEVVGQSAAFSADGAWFAFTARPADGSAGPDVYVWDVGAGEARQLTHDGASNFASWAGDQMIVSRPADRDAFGAPTAPASVTIDPTSGAETPADGTWRPVLDPTGALAVTWEGTIRSAGQGWQPASGRLVLRAWGDVMTDGGGARQVITDAPIADFDVRWDQAGRWFAVWTTDDARSSLGRLSLYRIDGTSGRLEQPAGAPADVPALSGFSIGEGRLAWVTPPGQGGEGSRVQIVAWVGEGVGTVETAPGEDIIVIR